MPCVATDVGSCKELVYGGEDPEDKALGSAGSVCQIANVEELAKGYIELLTNDERWLEAQAVAIKRVNTFYTQELFLNNYQKIYEDTFSKLESTWQE